MTGFNQFATYRTNQSPRPLPCEPQSSFLFVKPVFHRRAWSFVYRVFQRLFADQANCTRANKLSLRVFSWGYGLNNTKPIKLITYYLTNLLGLHRSHNRGRRAQVRAISSIGVGPMIWDNFSIFRTNCAIACGTRVYMLRGFLRMSRRGNGVRDSRYLLCFWPTTQHVYMYVEIWLKYFRRKLLQFEWSKAMSNLGMSSFISLLNQVVFCYFFLYKNFTFLHSNFHKSRRLTAFPWHSKKTRYTCI